MRIYSVNPNGFGVESIEKIEQMKRAIEENQIDYILISLPDSQQIPSNENQITRIFRAVYQNVIVHSTDSGVRTKSLNSWLPGRVITVIGGKWTSYVLYADTYKDSLGRWNTVKIQANNKVIMIVTSY